MTLRFFFYQELWRILLALLHPFKNHLPLKAKNYLLERELPQLVWRRPPRSDQRRIWFHAASGEVEYIKPILRHWRQQHTEDLLFITYFSTSARSLLNGLPELDGWAPLPYDLPETCDRFLDALNPQILIIARTDLWPNLLSRYHGPKILVASTWAEGSKKTRGFGRWMSRWCLGYLNQVCVVADADRAWLEKHSPQTSVSMTGDPRFDQVEFRLQQRRPLPAPLRQWAETRSVLVAGSTWEEDERILLAAWTQIRTSPKETDDAKKTTPWPLPPGLLLVPHETTSEHLERLFTLLAKHGLPFQRWTEIRDSRTLATTDILIFDQKGWLAELYQLGSVAFVGGSFKRQVHSVMEALGWGSSVIVGPYYQNNREALEFVKIQEDGHFFLRSVNDSVSLARELKNYWQLPVDAASRLKQQIRQAFFDRCHATVQTYQEILRCLS